MNATKKQARMAGLLYLLASIPAPFGLIYVPGKVIVLNDATATGSNLRTHEALVRLGIASELIGFVLFILVVLALYRLFKAVNGTYALAMMILILVSIPVSLLSVANEIAALIVAGGANFLSAFDQAQLDGLAYLFMRLHSRESLIAEIFWGLWLFPFGILVIRSRFIPRVLGVLLIVAAFGYLAESITFLLLPAYGPAVDKFAMNLTLCELPIIFWLLIWGARDGLQDESYSKAVAT